MPQDIRSFFTVLKKPSGSTSSITPAKKRSVPLDSSDEDFIADTPEEKRRKADKPQKKRKVFVISSDSEAESSSTHKEHKNDKKKSADEKGSNEKNKNNKSKSNQKKRKGEEKTEKLKPMSALEAFGNTPIKQTKVESSKKKDESKSVSPKKTPDKNSSIPDIGIYDDPDFEKTLIELDEEMLLEKSVQEPPTKKPRKDEEDLDSTMDPDQEKYEKKRHSAVLYKNYLNRPAPEHLGQKELPKGKPTCLANLCFIKTGVLDSLDQEQFECLIKEHGGRTVKAISKKVNYLVAGNEPGPAKLAKAQEFHIKVISEDELLDIILIKSGEKPKYSNKDISEFDLRETNVNTPKKDGKGKKDNLNKSKVQHEDKKDEEAGGSMKKSTTDKSAFSSDKNKPNLQKLQSTNGKDKDVKIEQKTENDIKKEFGDKSKKEHGSKVKKEVEEKINKERKEKSPVKNKTASTEAKIKKENTSSTDNSKPSSSKSKGNHSKIVHSQDIPQIEKPKIEPSTSNLSWTEKYKPKDIASIIGQQGPSSNMKKLMNWLSKWDKNHGSKKSNKLVRPSPWAKDDDGAYFKAALLSGSPGVGKTTTATLVAKELSYDVVEFNASDTRSKKLLHEEVSQLLSTTSLAGYFINGSAPTRKHVLLMDEVDGMAGNEDRGGIQELINLIKKSSVPIICMCNDRNHQKIRSLVNYCYDLRFAKPRMEQIRGAMMSICFKEGLKIPADALAQVITGAGNDIRQVLNHLSMWTADEKNLSADKAEKEANAAKKDTVMGPWEVCRKVFSKEDHKTMSVADKSRLFFFDYSLAPLFVQENYLQVVPHCPENEKLSRYAQTADSLSLSDIVDKKIRSSNNWSLLEVQAMYASVLPGYYMEGHVGGQINFPSWLGKNSKRSKFQRLVCELQAHMRTTISGSRESVNMDYIYHLKDRIIKPLENEGMAGVEKAIDVMSTYHLTREDFDSIIELSQWPHSKDAMRMVDSKIKAAFTRNYNKNVVLPYAVSAAPVKKKAGGSNEIDYGDEEEEAVSDNEKEDDVTTDAMIKEKKKAAPKGKKDDAGPSTSKKGGSRGKKAK